MCINKATQKKRKPTYTEREKDASRLHRLSQFAGPGKTLLVMFLSIYVI